MSRPIVAIAAGSFGTIDGLGADFADSARLRTADLSTPDSAAATTEGAEAVVVTLQRLSAPIISALAPTVRVIGRAGVGLDTIDLSAAEAHGIAVFNQPAYAAAEVATHAVSMLLTLQRRLLDGDRHVRGGWTGPLRLGELRPLDEQTAGVLGCGRIGAQVVPRLAPFVRRVVAYDPGVTELPEGAERLDSLDSLLASSDVLTLHLPLTPSTRDSIGMAQLKMLPPGAIVINVARGGIIDETALAELLHSGHLAGAGLDVFAEEPLPPASPLLGAPNTILTPHNAAYSIRSAFRLSHWTVADALSWLRSGTVENGSLVVGAAR